MKIFFRSVLLLMLTVAPFCAPAQVSITAPGTIPTGGTVNTGNLPPGAMAAYQRAAAAGDRTSVLPFTTDRALLFPTPSEYHLTPGDLISISLYGEQYTATARLDEHTVAHLPLLGDVSFSGQTLLEAQTFLARRLVEAGLFRAPEVSINIVESPNSAATVYGEVNSVVPVLSRRRLIDVILSAGGLPASASHVVTITRPGVAQPIVLDMGPNPYTSEAANVPVLPGDRVYISRAGIVYMVGAFKQQGVLPLSGNQTLTLMEAAALSGGPNETIAKYSDLRLIRTVNGQRTVVKLNIQKVLYGKSPDPVLMADDIVFLPSSALKQLITNGSLSTLLGVVSVALAASTIYR